MKLNNTAAWDRAISHAAKRDRFNEREAAQENAYARLADYIVETASRDEKLLEYRPRAVGVETVAGQDVLVVEDVETARFSAVLAAALLRMSEDLHEDGDRASLEGKLSYAEAVVLVRKHDGVRPAARATGYS